LPDVIPFNGFMHWVARTTSIAHKAERALGIHAVWIEVLAQTQELQRSRPATVSGGSSVAHPWTTWAKNAVPEQKTLEAQVVAVREGRALKSELHTVK
jgi:hypothetical protein